MNIRDYSSQFTVFTFSTNVDMGAGAKVHLSQAGYDSFFFQDEAALMQSLRESAPHILVFSTDSLSGTLTEFVGAVQQINDDIKFIVISSVAQFVTLAQYNAHGFVDVLSNEPVSIESRIVWAVDRACEKLYLTYQNEQLFDDLQAATVQVEELQKALQGVKQSEKKVGPPGPSVPMRIADYRSSQSKEDLLQKFLGNLGSSLCVYFKYLPSLRSFVATHANGIPGEEIQGVGVQLEADDLKSLTAQLALGMFPERFSTMLVTAFKFNPPKAMPLFAHNVLEGVFVYPGNMPATEIKNLSEEFTLLSLCYSNFVLERKVDNLDVQDFVTELYNRNYYHRTLTEEIQRAQRLKQPLSVIKLALDDFYELESSLGEAVRDELLKSVAVVVTKTSRTNDVTCRTGLNEIAMVLPHCSKKGAALRAERLRRIIEGTSFLNNGMKLSVSLGVSEYPTLCDSGAALDETASKALSHILDKGGNKICLYKASESHRPEFEVSAD